MITSGAQKEHHDQHIHFTNMTLKAFGIAGVRMITSIITTNNYHHCHCSNKMKKNLWSSFHVTGPICTIKYKSKWLCDSLLSNLCIASGRLLSHGTQRHENKCSECTHHALQTHIPYTRQYKAKDMQMPLSTCKVPSTYLNIVPECFLQNSHAQIETTAETAAPN